MQRCQSCLTTLMSAAPAEEEEAVSSCDHHHHDDNDSSSSHKPVYYGDLQPTSLFLSSSPTDVMEEAQQQLGSLKAAGASASEIESATFVTKRANMALSRAQTYGGQTEADIDIHVLQIGPIALASSVGEPFVETALGVKAGSPFDHTWFGGYVGGWAGYIPTADAYPLKGYEVETSPFAPEAEAVLRAATIDLLKEIKSGVTSV